MLMKIRDAMKKKDNQKGFTLIELIVVMAILAVLAAIAVPKYVGIQNLAKVKADAATARSIIRAARIQETDTGTAVDGLTSTDSNPLQDKYMSVPAYTQSNPSGSFTLDKTDDDKYEVTWTPSVSGYATEQTVTEGDTTFEPTPE